MSKLFRFKCTKCGNVFDNTEECLCGKCGEPQTISGKGILQLYRMGSPIGVAVGYGIYIDGDPKGYLANTESIRIPLEYGTHTVHMTCGATRKCVDMKFTLSPDVPYIYAKARIKPGFWTNQIVIEQSNAEDMPAL